MGSIIAKDNITIVLKVSKQSVLTKSSIMLIITSLHVLFGKKRNPDEDVGGVLLFIQGHSTVSLRVPKRQTGTALLCVQLKMVGYLRVAYLPVQLPTSSSKGKNDIQPRMASLSYHTGNCQRLRALQTAEHGRKSTSSAHPHHQFSVLLDNNGSVNRGGDVVAERLVFRLDAPSGFCPRHCDTPYSPLRAAAEKGLRVVQSRCTLLEVHAIDHARHVVGMSNESSGMGFGAILSKSRGMYYSQRRWRDASQTLMSWESESAMP
ncbi:hypothetical protein SODALDRAFT_358720 [Sodiomyces alkalinus F11]|uniref:Uncharacterized protein n=1 Tax=Sodiomyces alkalinus (strain CBS 110278 / VKM F-3762 / F11) TaxID=1314773 RepID=A0A3N2PWK3_SODAK|nr:hypothetical protein SODALDRAFT_358720 [Sodiomyces alkalinus F11]ROT38891.1 hypothetical protein SODALDRAFT_358720 [Sodiomyces alkalinus F11]